MAPHEITSAEKIVLGIDPGTNVMGYGVLHIKGSHMKLETAGIIHLEKIENHPLKLKHIFEKTLRLIESYLPDEMAIEAPFFGKNVQSMLKLGRAQGVALAAALFKNIPVFEYSPKKIKQSVTGNGSATKEQVAAMLQQLLHFEEMPKYLDATDGLAVAVCHHFQNTNGSKISGTKKGGWKSFVDDNPDKIIG
ncbi:MAG: Crossover junction endodeoxyribonuclease RuvC [Bacteroidia bacterium]|mgnify:CR=1 FL=1|nr:MAG: crossover junction endodeoxyribonuclease RuvC [Bacteroidetes bacterium OLB10]MBV6452799.1 Crossover junction endodeoxyribonuclease RuvC [Bacteroidia bacterium]HRV53598.1 crossover junction endodeoxyribonuclease RuvC [Bacteroidia bacterium]